MTIEQRNDMLRVVNIKHAGSYSTLYVTWTNMKARCNNKNSSSYKNYGAKGVKVCMEWDGSFSNFKQWALSVGYKEGLVLDKDILPFLDDRISMEYSPKNCIFTTRQINNLLKNNSYSFTKRSIGGVCRWEVYYKKKYIGTFKEYDDAINAYNVYRKTYIKNEIEKREL